MRRRKAPAGDVVENKGKFVDINADEKVCICGSVD